MVDENIDHVEVSPPTEGAERVVAKAEVRKPPKEKAKEAWEAIENGDDKEGKLLHDTMMDVFTSEPGKGPKIKHQKYRLVNKTFHELKGYAMDYDPGNANKIRTTLRSLHKQVGLDEYDDQIMGLEDASPESRQRMIKDKLLADVAAFPGLAVKHELQGYVDQVAWAKDKKEKLQEATKGKVERNKVRQNAYRLERDEARVKSIEINMLKKMGRWNKEMKSNLDNLREDRLSFDTAAYTEPDDAERGALEAECLTEYKTMLEERGDNRGAELMGKKEDDKKAENEESSPSSIEGPKDEVDTLMVERAEIQSKVVHARSELDKAIEIADAEAICKISAEISGLESQKAMNACAIDASMAGSRRLETKAKLQKTYDNFAMSLIEGDKDATKKLGGAAKEWAGAVMNSATKSLIKKFAPKWEKMKKIGNWGVEQFNKVRNFLDKNVTEKIKKATKWTLARIRDNHEADVAARAKLGAKLERGMLDARGAYYKSRYAVSVNARKGIARILPTGTLGEYLSVAAGDTLFAFRRKKMSEEEKEDVKKKIEQRYGEIDEKQANIILERDAKIVEKMGDSTHFAKMARLLEGKMIQTTGGKEVAEDETVATEAEDTVRENVEEEEAPTESTKSEEQTEEEADKVKLQEEADKLFEQNKPKAIIGGAQGTANKVIRNLQSFIAKPDQYEEGLQKQIRYLKIYELALKKVYAESNYGDDVIKKLNDYLGSLKTIIKWSEAAISEPEQRGSCLDSATTSRNSTQSWINDLMDGL